MPTNSTSSCGSALLEYQLDRFAIPFDDRSERTHVPCLRSCSHNAVPALPAEKEASMVSGTLILFMMTIQY